MHHMIILNEVCCSCFCCPMIDSGCWNPQQFAAPQADPAGFLAHLYSTCCTLGPTKMATGKNSPKNQMLMGFNGFCFLF